jgi:hypothetical protein
MRTVAVLLGMALAATVARADDAAPPAPDRWAYDSTISAGYRFTDVSGSEERYRSDVDLRQGPRLFLFSLDGTSPDAEKTPLDRFHLEVDTPGDEPASYFQLTAADKRRWDFRADFSRMRWDYDLPQLWEDPVPGNRDTVDLHQWNEIRTQGHADLTVHLPNDLPTIRAGYRLYERDGGSQSTAFVPDDGGNDFRLNAPVYSVANVGVLGTDFKWLATDWSLTQEYRVVDRRFDATRPVFTNGLGLDPASGVVLDAYDRRRGDHVSEPVTTVRLRHEFGDDLDVDGAYLYSHAELSDGVANRTRTVTSGTPATTATSPYTGTASGKVDTQVADLGSSYRLGHGVTLHATYRFNERSQDTNLAADTTSGPLLLDTGYHVRWNSLTGDLQYEPGAGVTLRAGVRYAHRDVNLAVANEKQGSDYIGAIADARWRPRREVDLFVRYENVQIDDPLRTQGDPLSSPPIPAREIALTSTNRATTGFRLTPKPWVALQYKLIVDDRQNDTFAAQAQSIGNNVGVTLTPLDALNVFAGYSRRDIKNHADITPAPLYDRTVSLQDGSEDAVTSSMRYEFPLFGQRWATGWDFSWVLADERLDPRLETTGGTHTPYQLDRIDGGAFLTFLHPWIEPSVEVRRIEYSEKALSANDFSATIVTLRLTKHFSR